MQILKVDVKSVLRIGSAHNKRGPSGHSIRIFRTFSELKLWFIFIYEHKYYSKPEQC